VTSLGLDAAVSSERLSTGIPKLDEMLDGKGFFKGSTILVSGGSGTGKSSLAAQFAQTSCSHGLRVLFLAFEESPSQILRNMSSIGIQLQPWLDQDRLRFWSTRPTTFGLEMHLVKLHKHIREFKPDVVVIDPISSIIAAGTLGEANLILVRIVDMLKAKGITGFFTSLTQAGLAQEQTEIGISSLVDTWILIRELESNGERNRGLYVLKSRGMPHSHQIREFRMSARGIELEDVCVANGKVLIGSARIAEEAAHRSKNPQPAALANGQNREALS
jgi:circadian clock protein KaiC